MCENNSKIFEVLEMIEDDIEINEDVYKRQLFLPNIQNSNVINY